MLNIIPNLHGIFSLKTQNSPLNNFISIVSLDLWSLSRMDFFLAIISAIAGFYFLIILLVLKKSNFPIWVTRKIVHSIGGTYIAFILFYFQSLLGVILAIGFFLFIFLILIFFSKFEILKEYFILKDCRDNEKDFTFLLNTSATLITLFVLLIIFRDNLPVFVAGTLIISWADTSGEVFGKRFPIGKFKIFNQKTASGTFAVFIFSLLSFVVTSLIYKIPFSMSSIWIILFGGILCAFAEAVSWKWLDNILLPVTGSLIMFWIVAIN